MHLARLGYHERYLVLELLTGGGDVGCADGGLLDFLAAHVLRIDVHVLGVGRGSAHRLARVRHRHDGGNGRVHVRPARVRLHEQVVAERQAGPSGRAVGVRRLHVGGEPVIAVGRQERRDVVGRRSAGRGGRPSHGAFHLGVVQPVENAVHSQGGDI